MDRLDVFNTQRAVAEEGPRNDPKIVRLQRFHTFDYSPPMTGLFCYEWSYIGANLLIEHFSDVYVLETSNHAVVYDSKNTWDFMGNFLFLDYRFPNLNMPNPPIKLWDDIPFISYMLERYYSREARSAISKKLISYKKVTKI